MHVAAERRRFTRRSSKSRATDLEYHPRPGRVDARGECRVQCVPLPFMNEPSRIIGRWQSGSREEQTVKGTCLCGAVSVTAPDQHSLSACHCSMCRRWGGGPLLNVHCGTEVAITGLADVTVFQSSQWAERAFCAKCGTHLYYRLRPANDYIVPAGLFQDGTQFKFEEQIFVDSKPSYYEFANATEQLTEAEVFAKYAPPST